MLLISIPETHAEQRLDNFLLGKFKTIARPKLYRMIRKGEIRINKKRSEASYRLQGGDMLRLPPSLAAIWHTPSKATNKTAHHSLATQLMQQLLYEDREILILNKPSGLAVHSGSGLQYGLIECLREAYPQWAELELVHRLDRETSGCLLLAKKRSMLRLLHQELREQRFNKVYHALLKNSLSQAQTVELSLKKIEFGRSAALMTVAKDGGNAITSFRPLQQYTTTTNITHLTLVEAKPITGKTHQIRVHAASMQQPIAGDGRYGEAAFNAEMRQLGLKRLFLHATMLEFTCPKTQQHIQVQAPYDAQLTRVLQKLQPCDTIDVC
jgi:23S rRNA pseudouridine955/2504/2580 synthase